MAALPANAQAEARRLLQLARRDRGAAREALAGLAIAEQVALVCEAPVARRAELLDLVPEPERVIPELPEAELCFTVKAVGLADASWMLAHATDEQVQACVDLDAWSDEVPDRARLGVWLAALAEAGDDALRAGVRSLDAELLMLWLTDRLEVFLKLNDDPGWQPPDGGRTLDGQFYVVARRSGDELEEALHVLELLFEDDYWLYFRLLQSTTWESVPENEEFALRWRSGRLQDLGFPPREEAIAIYAQPSHEELESLPEAAAAIDAWHLPVWMPELPTVADPVPSLLRAAAELDPAARRSFLYAFIALANQVAVADRLPLGDAESLPQAIDKASRLASRGLDWLAERHGVPGPEVLRRVPLARLVRIGTHLDPAEGAA